MALLLWWVQDCLLSKKCRKVILSNYPIRSDSDRIESNLRFPGGSFANPTPEENAALEHRPFSLEPDPGVLDPILLAENAVLAFAKAVLKFKKKALCKHVTMAMDGVVLSVPPTGDVARGNYCSAGESHMWRKAGEAAKLELSGADSYAKQIPYARAVPMWGGIGPGGFGLVMFHKWKKVNTSEWSKAVRAGQLLAACKSARPDKQRGPWRIICDNETFLEAPASRIAHRKAGVQLWHIPERSRDLNPVEKSWGWVRKQLRAKDLADLKACWRPVQKTALKQRVRALLRSAKAEEVAKNTFKNLRKTCQEVLKKKGAATRG